MRKGDRGQSASPYTRRDSLFCIRRRGRPTVLAQLHKGEFPDYAGLHDASSSESDESNGCCNRRTAYTTRGKPLYKDYDYEAVYNANEYEIIADINRRLQPCISSQS